MKLLQLVLACVLLLFIVGCGAGGAAADDYAHPSDFANGESADASAVYEHTQLPSADSYDETKLPDEIDSADEAATAVDASNQADSPGVAPLPVLYEEAVQIPDGFPIDLAKEILLGAREMFDRDDGQMWRRCIRLHVLLWCNETNFAVANTQDAQGRLAPVGGVYMGVMPISIQGWYERRTLGGESAIFYNFRSMLDSLVAESWPWHTEADFPGIFLGSIAHQAFHHSQLAIIGQNLGNPPPDQRNTEAMLLRSLETDALVRAMRAEGNERLAYLKDALSIRTFRREQVVPHEALSEIRWELQEGAAVYTELLTGIFTKYDLIDQIERFQEFFRGTEREGSMWAYNVGPMYILLIDEVDPELRHTLRFDVDLGEFVRELYGIEELPLFEGLGL